MRGPQGPPMLARQSWRAGPAATHPRAQLNDLGPSPAPGGEAPRVRRPAPCPTPRSPPCAPGQCFLEVELSV